MSLDGGAAVGAEGAAAAAPGASGKVAPISLATEVRPSPAWALLAVLGAGFVAVSSMNLIYDYRQTNLWLSIVFMVLGLPAAVAGSLKSRSRPCLLVFSLLFGIALGVTVGIFWLTALYAK